MAAGDEVAAGRRGGGGARRPRPGWTGVVRWRRRGRGPCRWSGSWLPGGGATFCWVVAQVGADPERHLGVPPRAGVVARGGREVVPVEGSGGERRGPHCSCRQEVAPCGRRPPRRWCRRRRLRRVDVRTGEVLCDEVALGGRPTPTVSGLTRSAAWRRGGAGANVSAGGRRPTTRRRCSALSRGEVLVWKSRLASNAPLTARETHRGGQPDVSSRRAVTVRTGAAVRSISTWRASLAMAPRNSSASRSPAS